MTPDTSRTQSPLIRMLNAIERAGNRLPNPTWLFIWLCLIILLLSCFAGLIGVSAVHPVSHQIVRAANLLSVEGLHKMLAQTVSNFTQFAPVGTVLVAIMGIGVAEYTGLLGAALRATVLKAPARLLSFIVVFAGVLSSLAADTGYVILIPLAAVMFHSAGRSPIAGIAAAFAGVSGGYSANLIIGPLDAILAGISTEAVGLVASDYHVSVAGNYYFLAASTLIISLLGTWVTESWVERRLPQASGDAVPTALTATERKGLRSVAVFSVIGVAVLLWGLVPEHGALRNPATGSVLHSPFIQGIVVMVSLYAALAGMLYGRVSGSITRNSDVVAGMDKSMQTMASYLVLMFFAAQFVSYFAWSNLGTITAIHGAQWLRSMAVGQDMLLACFILLAAGINLLIGSASAKWALMAPIFVPMFYLLGITPEATQMAYRIGDSATNIITPLMPYFGVVVAFVQRYDRQAGIGSIVAMMLPYSVIMLFGWSLLLGLWIMADLPLGPGVGIFLK